MANVDSKFGFRPVRYKGTGNVPTNTMFRYTIAANYTTKLHQGQVVELTGTGTNIQSAAKENTDNVGVFCGVKFVRANGEVVFSKVWDGVAGSKAIEALVWDDPSTVFEVQSDSLTEANVGALADHIVGTGNDLNGLAGSYLEGSVVGTSGKTFRILGLAVGQEYGNFPNVLVEFAEHMGIPGGGVGV